MCLSFSINEDNSPCNIRTLLMLSGPCKHFMEHILIADGGDCLKGWDVSAHILNNHAKRWFCSLKLTLL
jgi:hypothetical protein